MATAEQVEEALNDQAVTAGQTQVIAASVRLGEASNGERALFVRLTLSTPPEEAGTWPGDDLAALRRSVRDVILDLDPEQRVSWTVAFEPQESDELEPDDVADEIQIDP
jgi:hypothetical protein